MTPVREHYLRTADVARLLHVSPKTVARWAKEGRLPYRSTLGGHRRFPASSIRSLVEALPSLEHPHATPRALTLTARLP